MGRHKRRITKGSIFRDNVYSLLVVLLLVCCFGAWLHINNEWQTQAIAVTSTTIGVQDSEKGPLAVIQWQANGRTYSRATSGASSDVGSQQDVKYLPDEPERALTFLEVDGEPARIIGTPALVGLGLITLLSVWMNSRWGPRRADDNVVVAEVTEND